ncbi:uncharacterized protein LOC119588339 [Penaeus monodon]|uniref:uncharacterized protein LOC119588339 n=1 Tax=Penaeus monodon TaxID=6687 RepID=UPI0018A709D3|nr:uncharacterized protein LOC119588339 [Penaeus monodon]
MLQQLPHAHRHAHRHLLLGKLHAHVRPDDGDSADGFVASAPLTEGDGNLRPDLRAGRLLPDLAWPDPVPPVERDPAQPPHQRGHPRRRRGSRQRRRRLLRGTDNLRPCLIDDMIAIPAKSSGPPASCPEICHAEEFRSRVVAAPLKAGFSSWPSAGRSRGLLSQAASWRGSSGSREIDNVTVSLATVYYPSLTYREIIQSKPNFEMWFSSIGGHIGICLGASVISAIEILCFVITVLFLVFKKVLKMLCSC